MKPYLPSTKIVDKPSEKLEADSNFNGIAVFPVLSINPYFPLSKVSAKPSEKL